jgi:hypothetical protein
MELSCSSMCRLIKNKSKGIVFQSQLYLKKSLLTIKFDEIKKNKI